MRDALARTDGFVHEPHDNCQHRGVHLVVLVDHGQEPVVGTIDLHEALRECGMQETGYSYFIELACARLWFHTQRVRETPTERIARVSYTTLLDWREMHRYQVCFEDTSFGEVYPFADAGRIFFPRDFYQSIGNALLGLMDRHQRQRVRNPVHCSSHGYLPHYASERR